MPSAKKKHVVEPKKDKAKKGSKYDIEIVVDATFNDLLRAGMGLPVKEKRGDKGDNT